MGDAISDTIAYYERHAGDFAAQTGSLDLAPLYDRFLRHLPPGGRILDAGCGAGRDTVAFMERGYSIVGFDASAEMVRLTEERVRGNAQIHHLRFEQAAWHGEFDGIWACASILHVATMTFPDVAKRLTAALKPGGAWYLSFKLGKGESVAGDRLFVDHTEKTLRAALVGAAVELVETWTSQDVRPNRGREQWLNAIARSHA